MQVEVIEAITTIEELYEKGKRFYQSFLDSNMYYPETGDGKGGALDIRITEEFKGRDAYFKKIGTIEHTETALFKVNEQQSIDRLNEINEQLVSLTEEKRKIEKILE